MMRHRHQNTRAQRSIQLLALPLVATMLWASTPLDSAKYTYKAEARSAKMIDVGTPEDQQSGLVKFDPETMEAPSFPGGDNALMKFLASKIRYPKKAIEMNIQGRVIVCFEVDTEGNIKNPEAVLFSDDLLKEEALRVVKTMPKWVAGYYKDNKVKVHTFFSLPIVFSLP